MRNAIRRICTSLQSQKAVTDFTLLSFSFALQCSTSILSENRHILKGLTSITSATTSTFRGLGYERVYLSLHKVADTSFHIQGDDLVLRLYTDINEID